MSVLAGGHLSDYNSRRGREYIATYVESIGMAPFPHITELGQHTCSYWLLLLSILFPLKREFSLPHHSGGVLIFFFFGRGTLRRESFAILEGFIVSSVMCRFPFFSSLVRL